MQNDIFENGEDVNEKKIYVLIIYDIVDDKRRNQLVKFLRGYGVRIQKSAFEAYLYPKKYKKLIKEIGKYENPEDSIRIYKLPAHEPVLNWGKVVKVNFEDIIVI